MICVRLIADLLSKTVFMEKVGTGIKRIKTNCEKNKNKVKFKLAKNDFFVIITSEGVSEGVKVGEKVGERLTENQKLILKYISEDKYISIVRLSEKVGIATKNIEENIAKLKQKGLLKRIGPAKGGYWKVLNG